MIFGDALYFRPPQKVLTLCEKLNADVAADKIVAACIMGLIYGYLDYSLKLLNSDKTKQFIESNVLEQLKRVIKRYGKTYIFRKRGAGKIAELLIFMSSFFKAPYGGWASTGQRLGAVKKYGAFQ